MRNYTLIVLAVLCIIGWGVLANTNAKRACLKAHGETICKL